MDDIGGLAIASDGSGESGGALDIARVLADWTRDGVEFHRKTKSFIYLFRIAIESIGEISCSTLFMITSSPLSSV